MSNEVVLSSALRANLLSLQNTQSNIDKVQNILSTGLKVSSALDNPQNFFAAQSLKNRASDLTRLLDGIGQSVQTVKSADKGVNALNTLISQASSIVDTARDAITKGGREASVTSNTDLSKLVNLIDDPVIATNDQITFTIKKADGTIVSPAATVIGATTSLQEYVAAINDIKDTSNNQLLKAEITSAGNLKITGLNGATYNATIRASTGTAGGPEDVALASALGFGTVAKNTRTGGANSAVEFTAVPASRLVSGVFYDGSTGAAAGFAEASDALTTVRDALGDGVNAAGTARFATGTAGNNGAIQVTVNDNAVVNINFTDTTTTIQELVDGINTNANLNTLIKASYDATTGQFAIDAISSAVKTIQIGALANGTTTTRADFDFGTDDFFLTGNVANNRESETFTLGASASLLSQYENDYNTVRDQIDALVKDSGYRGVNLLAGDSLVTNFNEDRSSKLTTKGAILNSAGLGLTAANFSTTANIEDATTKVKAAQDTLRSFGATLSNSLSIIQTRESFTKDIVDNLGEGADKLTLADQNEEGAKLLALQTRQQLGVTALSLASQAQQSVLRLF